MKSRQAILILAPHTDDAELGCGGLIARKLEEGHDVHVAAFSTAEESLPPGSPRYTLKLEFYQAMEILGVRYENLHLYNFPVRRFSDRRQEILDELVRLRQEINPDVVLMPASEDIHQDHQVMQTEGLRAFKNATVLGYELPWNLTDFSAQAFLPLEQRHVERKWEALQAYQSQLTLKRAYFTKDFINGLAAVRGTQMKLEWAEAFEVRRMKL